jgi:hypothetical protein
MMQGDSGSGVPTPNSTLLLEACIRNCYRVLEAFQLNIRAPLAERISLVKTTNSVALVRQRFIPTERPPLVGEVCANFC